MTLLQKQTFVANYSYLTTHLIEIMERAAKANNNKQYQHAKNLVKTANEMYMYASMLEKEVEIARQQKSIEMSAKHRAIESLKKERDER